MLRIHVRAANFAADFVNLWPSPASAPDSDRHFQIGRKRRRTVSLAWVIRRGNAARAERRLSRNKG
jgi:hypothetical protein